MKVDAAPDLYNKIQAEFEKRITANKRIKNFRSREKHTAKEVSLYSAELGRCASETLGVCLTEDTLPNGKLYWNIAQRTIKPLLKTIYEMMMDAAEETQRQQDEQIGIRITPIRPAFPEERIDGLINKLIDYQEDEKNGK